MDTHWHQVSLGSLGTYRAVELWRVCSQHSVCTYGSFGSLTTHSLQMCNIGFSTTRTVEHSEHTRSDLTALKSQKKFLGEHAPDPQEKQPPLTVTHPPVWYVGKPPFSENIFLCWAPDKHVLQTFSCFTCILCLKLKPVLHVTIRI